MNSSHMRPASFHKMSNRCTRLLSAAALIALLTGCGVSSGSQPQPTPTPLPPQPAVEKPSYTVEQGDIVEELQLSGRVAATREDELAFEQAGNVAKIYVRATEPITKGQLLAELNLGDLVNQLQQAELRLDQAKLALRRGQDRQKFAVQLAELDLEEAQARLRLAGSAAERQLADIAVRRAEINLQEAEAGTDEDLEKQVDQAQLDYDRVKAQVDAGRLYSPLDGEVAAVAVQVGASVEAYRPVMSVIDPSERELRVDNALSTDLQRLSAKQEVTIRFSRYPDTEVKGVVERLPHQATSAETNVEADDAVHIQYDAADLDLDIGDLARVIVTLQRKENVLWLPPQAVRTFQGRRFVVIDDGERQRRVDVKLGIEGPDRVEIVEGLEAGQVIVGQ